MQHSLTNKVQNEPQPLSTLLSLAERCEAAAGPDRRIDGDIAEALSLAPPGLTIRSDRQPELFKDRGPGLHAKTWLAPAFSRSLDAAMTLVPEGWAKYVADDENGCHACVWNSGSPLKPSLSGGCKGAASLVLALCAAALRARAQHRTNSPNEQG